MQVVRSVYVNCNGIAKPAAHNGSPVGGDDHVRVAVEREEGRGLADAATDVPVDHDPALRREVVGEKDVLLTEPDGEGKLAQQRVDRNATAPLVAGVDILVARRVVQLLRLRPHEDEVVPELAVVD